MTTRVHIDSLCVKTIGQFYEYKLEIVLAVDSTIDGEDIEKVFTFMTETYKRAGKQGLKFIFSDEITSAFSILFSTLNSNPSWKFPPLRTKFLYKSGHNLSFVTFSVEMNVESYKAAIEFVERLKEFLEKHLVGAYQTFNAFMAQWAALKKISGKEE